MKKKNIDDYYCCIFFSFFPFFPMTLPCRYVPVSYMLYIIYLSFNVIHCRLLVIQLPKLKFYWSNNEIYSTVVLLRNNRFCHTCINLAKYSLKYFESVLELVLFPFENNLNRSYCWLMLIVASKCCLHTVFVSTVLNRPSHPTPPSPAPKKFTTSQFHIKVGHRISETSKSSKKRTSKFILSRF